MASKPNYAALGLATLVVLQFIWWNKKCPGVLKGY